VLKLTPTLPHNSNTTSLHSECREGKVSDLLWAISQLCIYFPCPLRVCLCLNPRPIAIITLQNQSPHRDLCGRERGPQKDGTLPEEHCSSQTPASSVILGSSIHSQDAYSAPRHCRRWTLADSEKNVAYIQLRRAGYWKSHAVLWNTYWGDDQSRD
jgi:hypothetical protein